MQYQQAIEYLYTQLPAFSKYGKSAIKDGLGNITKLCAALGNPHEKLNAIHIAGTNGKGSTSHLLASILQEASYKTGLYTSPHLIDFRERIKINGEEVSKDWVVEFVVKHRPLFDQIEPSFFEVTVAMAFQYFAEQKCDVVVIETGLGGRLDSTNIITPILSIITNISLDHTDILGDTLGKIAEEKAGIIKEKVPFIIGERQKETEQIFFEHAIRKQCSCFYADAQWGIVRVRQDAHFQYLKVVKFAAKEMFDIRCELLSNYQLHNIKTALTAAEMLAQMGFRTGMEECARGIERVKINTKLRGRWEKLQNQSNTIIADVAHNPAGIKEMLIQWDTVKATQKHIVIGFVKDKDVQQAMALLPKDAAYYFCNANTPRALLAEDLRNIASAHNLQGIAYRSVADAVENAQKNMSDCDALLITGSFFVVGEALNFLEQNA